MTHPSHPLRHLCMLALAAGLTLSATAARADATLPGVMCSSDGATDKPTSGALMNSASASGTSKFHCPIVRMQAVSIYGGTLSVSLNAKLNYHQTYECVLRSTLASGAIFDSTSIVLPPKTSGNGGNWTVGLSVTLPPALMASVNLRCNVPNLFSGESAGIVSYKIND